MAATLLPASYSNGARKLERWTELSAANTQITPTTTTDDQICRKLVWVGVKYSASVSVTITVTLDAGAGTEFDHIIQSTTLSSDTDYVFIPDNDLIILAGDAIVVTAPAGGVGVTAGVSIYTEVQ